MNSKSDKLKRNQRTNLYRYLVYFILLLVVCGVWIGVSYARNEDTAVAEIQGEPISVREFKLFVDKNRASIFRYFQQTYGAENSASFWGTPFGGETPANKLKAKALQEAVTVKQQQIAAKKYGVMKDISYEGFLKSLLKENERRRSALQNRQVIYGPQTYDERGYFEYAFDTMIGGLKATWSQADLNMSEEQLRLYYESVKERQYKNADTLTLEKLSISYSARTSEEMSAQRVQASQRMLAIKKDLDQEANGAEKDQYGKSDRIKLVSEIITLDPNSSNKNLILAPLMMETAYRLKAGQTSDVLEEDGAFLILRCVERKEGGYKSFEVNRDLVKSNYVDSKYEEFVGQMLKTVPYTTNKSIYDSFAIN